jgi:cellulase/cellobiase CelA1
MPSHAGNSAVRRVVGAGASTLAVLAGLLAALGPAMPAKAAPATSSTISSTLSSGMASAMARIVAASSSLSCVYEVTGVWPGGFAVQVTITNTGSSPVPGWSLTWTWPGGQRLTSGWNASFAQSGATVTVTGTSANGTIAPGGSVTFGFIATGTPPPVLPIPCTRIG